MKQVRLLKVVVQVVVAIDDGEQLEERVIDPVTISAADWLSFATSGLENGLKELQAQIDAEDAAWQGAPARAQGGHEGG